MTSKENRIRENPKAKTKARENNLKNENQNEQPVGRGRAGGFFQRVSFQGRDNTLLYLRETELPDLIDVM